MSDEIAKIEKQLFELTSKLNELRKTNSGNEVRNYTFSTMDGDVSLLDMFGENDRLLVIHNMGRSTYLRTSNGNRNFHRTGLRTL